MIGPVEMLVIFLVVVLFALGLLIPFWLIFSKAGFPGALSFLMLIPAVNIVMLYFLAFSEWPAFRQKRLDDRHRS